MFHDKILTLHHFLPAKYDYFCIYKVIINQYKNQLNGLY